MSRAVLPSSLSASYELDRASGLETGWEPLASLAADPGPWRELVRQAIEPNVFLEPGFAGAAVAAGLGGADVHAVTVRTAGRLVGLLPGYVEGLAAGRPVPTFVAWTHPFAPLSTPLIDRYGGDEAMAAMLDFLPSLPGAPRLALFPLLAEEGPAAKSIARQLARAGHSARRFAAHQRAAFVPERDQARFGLSTRKFKELRRQRRRLSEMQPIAWETVAEAVAIGEAVAAFLDVESSGWKGRAGTAARANATAAQFVTRAVTSLAREGKARVDLLKLGGRTVAAAIVLFSGDRAWFWKTAFDEAYASYSPGVQLALDLTTALADDHRIALVDSCAVADHPMIDRLWSGRMAIADWLIPLAGSSSFAVGAAAERAQRALAAPLKLLKRGLRR
jgi:CelD/BcsL family acetyltransferase involved in cellulose biosynthesis